MSESNLIVSRFPLGQMVMTKGVVDLVDKGRLDFLSLLRRHAQCDWGDLCDEDKAQNDFALLSERRLLSCYRMTPEQSVYIITEWDRSYTTILLPSEY